MRTSQEYREEFSRGLFELIMRISMSPDGKTSMVQAGEIIDEMLSAIAMLGHGSTEVSTPAKMRKKCDELARTIQKRMSGIQRLAQQGRVDWMQTVNLRDEN